MKKYTQDSDFFFVQCIDLPLPVGNLKNPSWTPPGPQALRDVQVVFLNPLWDRGSALFFSRKIDSARDIQICLFFSFLH